MRLAILQASIYVTFVFYGCKFILFVFYLVIEYGYMTADCYDPLDPNGNVTVTFDIIQWAPDGYVVSIIINNCTFSLI